MATRKEITEDIKRTYGAALNIRQVCEYFGFKRTKARSWLADLDCYDTGRDKKYLAIDLARKMDCCNR